MRSNHYCIILAGGVGSRFWPLSKASQPKQFIDVLGTGKSFIRMTFDRLSPLFPTENFYVMTGEAYREDVLAELPMLKAHQVLTEPERRNTAPCIAYAAYKLKQKDPNALLLVTPSDHYIADEGRFRDCIAKQLEDAEKEDALFTIGIRPTYPAIGYGYIEVEQSIMRLNRSQPVLQFKEKPSLPVAVDMLAKGNYLWNSGMFIWKASVFTSALEAHLPEVSSLFAPISSYNTPQESADVRLAFLRSPSVSIDYGLIEKAHNVKVAPSDFGWSDLGTWESLYRQLDKDDAENAVSAPKAKEVDLRECRNLLVKSSSPNKRLVLYGIEDMLVVDTPETLFISRRGDEAAMHEIIKEKQEK
ncbi:hypothetical protein HQ39_05300 [Porphyromonas sp. COT-108 OH2963]|uniref:mannose-1-phosphate guanylyltransferase n=1 Tax=Porphyromonas sp. COT-108 OH2963 TaxID=1515614 RepID=UPI00052DC150|nr:mannose-1-phosphate guanylyltransferase [Porphyromonas sp. COT-108 OH2963]KGN95653.1 hypothetical protein HQ39_05300 [Porphyromonas sp. COT-108 OH2963]